MIARARYKQYTEAQIRAVEEMKSEHEKTGSWDKIHIVSCAGLSCTDCQWFMRVGGCGPGDPACNFNKRYSTSAVGITCPYFALKTSDMSWQML